MKQFYHLIVFIALFFLAAESAAQEREDTLSSPQHKSRSKNILTRVDSILTLKYRKGGIDTLYLTRPKTKWTFMGRLNISGANIETEGRDDGKHFISEMTADYKSTLSIGVSYLGFSLNAALNPAKMMGKYRDYELNFNSYGKRFGFDIIYQDAHNFTGWHETDGQKRVKLPADMLTLRTLNMNAYYSFNSRRFSYPAAFSQSYIQRRSAGSFMLAVSGQGQHGSVKDFTDGSDHPQTLDFKMTNIGIGAGYGYNYVPSPKWLFHISALPTFIVYSNTSMTFGDTRIPLHHHFPEIIITGRGAIIRQIGNKFFGLSMVYNFTNVGDVESLSVYNTKYRIRCFYGFRL